MHGFSVTESMLPELNPISSKACPETLPDSTDIVGLVRVNIQTAILRISLTKWHHHFLRGRAKKATKVDLEPVR